MKDNIRTLIIVFITSVVTAFDSNIVDLVFQTRSYNLEQERNLAILYYDIKDGIDAVNVGLILPYVLDNSYSAIYKDYFKYL